MNGDKMCEPSKKRQLTLFGTRAKEKTNKYVVFKNPRSKYEEFVERYCIRARKTGIRGTKKTLFAEAQIRWKNISLDIADVNNYLKLRDGEKDFVR